MCDVLVPDAALSNAPDVRGPNQPDWRYLRALHEWSICMSKETKQAVCPTTPNTIFMSPRAAPIPLLSHGSFPFVSMSLTPLLTPAPSLSPSHTSHSKSTRVRNTTRLSICRELKILADGAFQLLLGNGAREDQEEEGPLEELAAALKR